MNIKKYAIPIILFIFLINTASAIQHEYVSLTVTPGEELSQVVSFSGAYSRLFATADASGNAALWVTPRRVDFGPIDPGEVIERDYTISVPRSQKPGYYELVWKYSCKYTDGTTCTAASDTVIRITVEGIESTQTYTASDQKSLPLSGNGRQVLNPTSGSSDDSILMGIIVMFIVFIIFFIIGIYIIVWVVKDANKRGNSGIFWGLLTFFLGILGLIIYLLARTGGRIIPCNFCGKEKLESLTKCPHCNRSTTTAYYRPAPAPMTTGYPVSPQKPEVDINELKKQKETLNKINTLLEKLDERLALGEITEARYTQLREQYTDEAEKLKNQITEKELVKEVGL